MAYKWILNGCEIRYLSKPKPIQNQSNTVHKIINKHKLVWKPSGEVHRKPSSMNILCNQKAHKNRIKFCFYGLLKFDWDERWFSFHLCGSNSSGFWMLWSCIRFRKRVMNGTDGTSAINKQARYIAFLIMEDDI